MAQCNVGSVVAHKSRKKAPVGAKNVIDRDRTRTCNPQIRSLVPYPLGHTVSLGWRAPLPNLEKTSSKCACNPSRIFLMQEHASRWRRGWCPAPPIWLFNNTWTFQLLVNAEENLEVALLVFSIPLWRVTCMHRAIWSLLKSGTIVWFVLEDS